MAKTKTVTGAAASANADVPMESTLKLLYELQQVDSRIDAFIQLRGELPIEVQDLEDGVAALDLQVQNYQKEALNLESMIQKKKNDIDTSKLMIKKYLDQQKSVRNNREFDSLSKEVEFQTLEIELNEKRIKEFTFQAKEKKVLANETASKLSNKKIALEEKEKELKEIMSETKHDEDELRRHSASYKSKIELRLYNAYQRIRKNARNGLAVVPVVRDACGGCFNKIPPQRQADIRLSKKIIVCEYCGRVLISTDQEAEAPAK
ncbi:MAG: C4-type zinc ribbon domain-containing protein, partial [Prevotellaceae bacterium]|nr:C4-type zinc ribbon domain-containing protein [Prevotellaceae bacterium]